MIRHVLVRGKALEEFHEYWAAQLNDTHPSIAVAELMRLLVDEHLMDWDRAWTVTQKTFAYTNRSCPRRSRSGGSASGKLLPRHLGDHLRDQPPPLDGIRTYRKTISFSGGCPSSTRGSRSVRMAHLACVGSHAINGVAALLAAPRADGAPRLHAMMPEVPERDQRRDAPPLDRAEQSEARR
jgi:starch phosphorylase